MPDFSCKAKLSQIRRKRERKRLSESLDYYKEDSFQRYTTDGTLDRNWDLLPQLVRRLRHFDRARILFNYIAKSGGCLDKEATYILAEGDRIVYLSLAAQLGILTKEGLRPRLLPLHFLSPNGNPLARIETLLQNGLDPNWVRKEDEFSLLDICLVKVNTQNQIDMIAGPGGLVVLLVKYGFNLLEEVINIPVRWRGSNDIAATFAALGYKIAEGVTFQNYPIEVVEEIRFQAYFQLSLVKKMLPLL